MSDRNQLAARIDVRSSPEFYETLKGAAKRAQLSVSDYTRLAIAERMALDELGDGRPGQMKGNDMADRLIPWP